MATIRSSDVQLKSLVHACASKITSDYQMAKEAADTIPQELFQILLAVAIRNGQSPATKVLVSRWPYRVLNLCNVLSYVPQPRLSLSDVKNEIMVTILCAVAGVSSCKAKVIDLQGVQLSCFETKNCLQAMLNSFKTTTSGQSRIIIDMTVGAQNFHIVSKAMKKFSEGSELELLCGKMRAEGLQEDKLIKLIKFLNSDVAQVLSLSLNSLSNAGLTKVLPHVKRLKNLQSLDLSYNIVDLSRDAGGNVCRCVKEVFSSLPKLQDVTLGFNRITGRLLDIVSSLQSPVRLLKLDSCFLNAGDLSFLANTMDTNNLEALDLSGNTLSTYIQSLENLLLRSCHSLVKLNLDGTSLSDNDLSVNVLTRVAKSFKKLMFFSMQYNGFVREQQVEVVSAYASIPTVTLMQITDVRDELDEEDAYNLALRLGGIPCNLFEYHEALENIKCADRQDSFHLEIRDSETGTLFVDPSDYNFTIK